MLEKYSFRAILLWVALGSSLAIACFHALQKPSKSNVALAVETAKDPTPTSVEYPHKASSYFEKYYPENLLDGNPDTFWHVSEVGKPAWVLIDLGTDPGDVINSFQALPRKDSPSSFWRRAILQGSNNSRYWTRLADLSVEEKPASNEWLTWYFDAKRRYRYYRLSISSGFYQGRHFVAFSEWRFDHSDLTAVANMGSTVQIPDDPLTSVFMATYKLTTMYMMAAVFLVAFIIACRLIRLDQKIYPLLTLADDLIIKRLWMLAGDKSVGPPKTFRLFVIISGISLITLFVISYFPALQGPPEQHNCTASSYFKKYSPENLLDGNPNTFWHVSEVGKPAWVLLDFGTNSGDVINSFQALPRKDALNNFWHQAILQGSNNGRFWTRLADLSVEEEPTSAEWTTWYFDASRKYQYYRLFITSGFNSQGRFLAFAGWRFDHCDLSEVAHTGSTTQTPNDSLLSILLATPEPVTLYIIPAVLLILFAGIGWLIRSFIKELYIRHLGLTVPVLTSWVVDYLDWLTMGTWSQKNYRKEVFTLSLIFLCYLIPKGSLLANGTTFRHDAILHYAAYHYFIESLWNGFWPLWNPYMHGGEPFYLYWGYFCALDPTILGCAVLSYFDLSIFDLYHWNYIFRTLVIILGLYLVFRRLFKNVLSTYVVLIVLLFGALTSDFYICHHRLDAFRWFPWAFYFLLRLLNGGGPVNLLCIAYLMGITIGSSVYHWPFTLFAFTLFLVTLGINHRDTLKQIWTRLIRQWRLTLLSGLVFLGLCLPLLTPLADMQKFFYPTRNLYRDGVFFNTALFGVGKSPASTHFEHPENLKRLFLPTVKHVKEGGDRQGDFLIGVIPTVFLLLGILCGRGRFKSNFTVILIVIALLMVGCRTFFPWLVYPIFPPLYLISSLTWFEPFLMFCAAFFIGLGMDFVISLTRANDSNEDREEIYQKERYEKVYYAVRDLFMHRLQRIPARTFFIITFCILGFASLNLSYVNYGLRFLAKPDDWKRILICEGFNYWISAQLFLVVIATTSILYLMRNWVYNRLGAYLFISTLFLFVMIYQPPKSGWEFLFAIYIILVIGSLFHIMCEKLRISVSAIFSLWILVAVFVELIMITGDYHSHFFVPKTSYFPVDKLMFETHRQDPVFPAERQPNFSAKHGFPIGVRFRSLVFKVNSAINETLPPKGKHDATTNIYEETYHCSTLGQTHAILFKTYLQLYEIGEQSIPKFEALMGVGEGRSMLQFYRHAIIMNNDETNTLFFQLPYEKLGPILDSAVFVNEPLEEQFKSIETNINNINISRDRPHFEYKVIKYNPNHLEIDVQVNEDGILHFLDGYDNYWEVYVDGKQRKMYNSNLAFKAVAVEKGQHRVVFNYNPIYFLWGLRIYLVANFVFIAFVFLLCVRKQGSDG